MKNFETAVIITLLASIAATLALRVGFDSFVPFLGNMPLDFEIVRGNFLIKFPAGSAIILSIVLNVLWFTITKIFFKGDKNLR